MAEKLPMHPRRWGWYPAFLMFQVTNSGLRDEKRRVSSIRSETAWGAKGNALSLAFPPLDHAGVQRARGRRPSELVVEDVEAVERVVR